VGVFRTFATRCYNYFYSHDYIDGFFFNSRFYDKNNIFTLYKKIEHNIEPAIWQKLVWGIFIGAIAYFMVAYAGGVQGIDGVNYLTSAGGSAVLFVFILQLASGIKMFIFDEIQE